MYKQPLFRLIAQQVGYYHDSKVSAHRSEDQHKHEYALESLMRHMPSGSGIDSGTKLLLEDSSKDKLVFRVDYHHMDQNGFYCGWSSRLITITPSLISDYNMEFSEEDYSGVATQAWLEQCETEDCQADHCDNEEHLVYDDIEFIQDSTGDYLADTYRYALEQEYELTLKDYEAAGLSIHGSMVVT